MSLFIRTLQRSTAVSSACVVNIKGKEWMLVCRPKTFIELWSEADGCLTPRGATELGEVTHVVPLPQLGADVAFFLAITASDRYLWHAEMYDAQPSALVCRRCGLTVAWFCPAAPSSTQPFSHLLPAL